MATAKKPAPKKATPARKPAAKKPVAKKTTKAAKVVPMRSFKIAPDEPSFFTLRITKQTVYWSILLIFILITQLWILNAQLDVIQALDSSTITE
jgi:hypothetical protein